MSSKHSITNSGHTWDVECWYILRSLAGVGNITGERTGLSLGDEVLNLLLDVVHLLHHGVELGPVHFKTQNIGVGCSRSGIKVSSVPDKHLYNGSSLASTLLYSVLVPW